MAGVMGGAARWGALLVGGLALVAAAAWGLARAHEAMAAARLDPEGSLTANGQLSPDGRFLAVLRSDGAAEILAAADGRRLGLVRGHGADMVSASFSADGRTLMTVDAAGRAILTRLDGEAFREAVHGEALARAAEQGAWSAGLRRPAAALWEFGWRDAPWSTARRIMDARALAPILSRGAAPPPGTMFRDCDGCPQMVVVPAGDLQAEAADPAAGANTFSIVFDGPVRGVAEGTEVLFNGIRVGEIRQLSIDRDNPSRVVAGIRVDAQTPVRTDSTARLRLLGDGQVVVELTSGDPRSSLLAAPRGAAAPMIRTAPGDEAKIAANAGSLAAPPPLPPSPQAAAGPPTPMPVYAVGRFEVTVAEFRRFAEETGYEPRGGCSGFKADWKEGDQSDLGATWRDPRFPPPHTQGESHPVVCMGYADAAAYARWLSAKTGERYHLPTGPEWEYAARGGAAGDHWFGEDEAIGCRSENFRDRSVLVPLTAARPQSAQSLAASSLDCDDGAALTSPAGAYRANAFGLFDVLGNAAEWTSDCSEASDCAERDLRGGAFIVGMEESVASVLTPSSVTQRTIASGFRVVREIRCGPAVIGGAACPAPAEPVALTAPETPSAALAPSPSPTNNATLEQGFDIAAGVATPPPTSSAPATAAPRAPALDAALSATLARFVGRWGEIPTGRSQPDCDQTITIETTRRGQDDHFIIRTPDPRGRESSVDYTITAVAGSAVTVRANDGSNATGEFALDPKGSLNIVVSGQTVARGGRCAS
jgi:formylglycine-generating enzyme required for sulfatase activity